MLPWAGLGCVLGGSIGRVVDSWPSLPFLGGRLEAGFALRPRAFRQAPPIFSVGVINLGGPESSPTCAQGSRCFPDILWCGLAPQTSPSHFLAELGGTSSLRARWWSVPVPNVLHRSNGL